MKLKCLPEDFQVQELSEFEIGAGPIAVYKLTKRSLGTPEAIEAVVQRWKVQRDRVSYGGLKDRHAVTEQFVTIQRGPRKDLEQASFSLVYQGQTKRHFGPPDIAGNRFRIVIRDLSKSSAERIVALRESVLVDRLPNYFDDQRFGSLGTSGEFIAQPWCAGNYERAVWLAIAEPNTHDRPSDKEEKKILREHWGNWENCKKLLPKSTRRSVVTYLVDHPTDFKHAISLIRSDLRGLYLSAYQSFLWNHILSEFIRDTVHTDQLFTVPLAAQQVPFFTELSASQQQQLTETRLPLPSARIHLPEGPIQQLYDEVLGGLGTKLTDLKIKHPRESFFSKGERPALIVPHALQITIEEDERYPKRVKATLSFELPRGSYATILLKRLTLDPIAARREPSSES